MKKLIKENTFENLKGRFISLLRMGKYFDLSKEVINSDNPLQTMEDAYRQVQMDNMYDDDFLTDLLQQMFKVIMDYRREYAISNGLMETKRRKKITQKQLANLIKETIMENKYKRGYTICLDFDGTCVTHNYPEVGEDIGAVPVLKKIVECGNRIILYTIRSHRPYFDGMEERDLLQEAINWFEENGVPLYGVNSHPTQHHWTDSPKVHGDITIDDRNFGCPCKWDEYNGRYVDWKMVEKGLIQMGVIM